MIDKVFKTKMGEGYLFKVTEVNDSKVRGYYVGDEHIGVCTLPQERLYAGVIPDTTVFEYWFNRRIQRLSWLMDKQLRELQYGKG